MKTVVTKTWQMRLNCTKNASPIVKGGNAMNYFLAVNDRQLGTCLRMLFAEGIQGIVQVVLNDKNKIEFHISIAADDDLLDSLKERYTILIS